MGNGGGGGGKGGLGKLFSFFNTSSGDGGGGGNGGNGTSTTVSFFVSGLSVVVVSFFTFSFSSLLLLQEATAKSNVANDKRPMTFFLK